MAALPERTREVAGRTLYWCSAFAAYILPARCKAMVRFGENPSAMIRKGRATYPVENEHLGDLRACARDRLAACKGCPGVVRRSLRESKRGDLA